MNIFLFFFIDNHDYNIFDVFLMETCITMIFEVQYKYYLFMWVLKGKNMNINLESVLEK